MSEENETKKKKKGNFFTNLLFTQDGETQEVQLDETDDISVSNNGSSESIPLDEAIDIPLTGDGVFDQKFNDSLQQLIVENNIPGVDYFEFREALKGMKGIAGLNEATSFQTVYTTLKVGDPSLTKEKLLSSVDHYVNILGSEESDFNSEMESQTDKEVASRRNKAERLNTENQDLVQQIQNLNEQISRNNDEAVKLNSEAASAEAQIGQTAKNFVITISHIKSNLEEDKQKIEQLIKG